MSNTIGTKVREAREKKGWSIYRLAKMCCTSCAVINNIEIDNSNARPSNMLLQDLAESLQLDYFELLEIRAENCKQSNMELPVTEIGRFVRKERLRLGMSLNEFATACDLSRMQIRNIEQGVPKIPRTLTLNKIANFLEVNVEILLEFTNQQSITFNTELGKIIQNSRLKNNLSISRLSKITGIKAYIIQKMEKGERFEYREYYAETLAKTLKLDYENLRMVMLINEIGDKKITRLAVLIKTERLKRNMSKSEFAEACNVSANIISTLENKSEKKLQRNSLQKIATYIDKEYLYLMEYEFNRSTFGKIIFRERTRKQMSSEELSQKSKISKEIIIDIEAGKLKDITEIVIESLAKALDLDSEYLIEKFREKKAKSKQIISKQICKMIKRARVCKKMSQIQLSGLTKIQISRIEDIEAGNIKYFTQAEVECLTKALDIYHKDLISELLKYNKRLLTRQLSNKELGKIICEVRHERRMTQQQLSRLSGIGRKTISDLEIGKTKCPKEITIECIAEVLGLDAKVLINYVKKNLSKKEL